MAQLILLPGKERSAFKHHPWLFAGSVGRLEGRARPGDTVEVLADNLRPLGRAAYSPKSQIRARFWTFDADESIDDAFFKRRIAAAVALRQALPELRGQQGLRLIHAESDGLPGVIADQYGDTVVVQLTSAGADKWRSAIVAGLVKETGCARVYERSDSDVRGLEGLGPTTGWLHGEAPATPLAIDENGVRLAIDIAGGHKTGFYLDQRENRSLLGQLSTGKDVLNCFCYTAGFSLQALAGGAASVLSIDSSGPALAQAQANLALNPTLPADRAQWQEADVFQALRDFRKAGRLFDVIVLDPPKFAPSAAHADRAAKAYKDINILGFRLLRPGGFLMTYSCSGGVGLEMFQKIIADSALDAGRSARIVRRLSGAADHPVALNFPEGEYLKGLLVQAD
ncbi:class I SAM-dependent rRNA methyltransferase [Dechloromonas sp. HYN0024]|uniref:class I SAM-dependent rRNA methyltransferase n=1 Tax=Dechloromonas sp. HYN0024 TaxID=2231055 RepID=UPI000E4464C6|nr:class I SAM-dependent methyltransferase [Dechloromonas sp. HYN0024]AXS78737.1 23S rRNA (cytosine(1962)-C(5))-methyltransferase RlmI [Dechloromonas sp. HYN0024]